MTSNLGPLLLSMYMQFMVHCQYVNLLVVYSWSPLVDVSVAWICPSHIRYLHKLAELRCTDNQHLSSKNSWRFEDTVWSNGYKFKEVVILVKTNFTPKEMSPNGWGPRPHYTPKTFENIALFVRLGLMNLKTSACVFVWTEHENGAFRKTVENDGALVMMWFP